MSVRNMTWRAAAERAVENAKRRVRLGENSPFLAANYRAHFSKTCKFFGDTLVTKIDRAKIRDFRDWLADQGLKPTSIKPALSFVSIVLKEVEEDGLIQAVPQMPRVRQKDSPRSAFDREAYGHLLKFMKAVETGKPELFVRGHRIDWELRFFTTFLVNSFLRPADVVTLQHHHVRLLKNDDGEPYLRLDFPSSKGHADPVITMPAAALIYSRLIEKRGGVRPDDYLFLPQRLNRRMAREVIRRQFNAVLVEAGLKTNHKGEPRSLYSLRHSAITFRLLNSENLDLLTLARTCRTSVEMIDRFYARSLTAEMNKDKLHSFSRPTRYRLLG